MYGIRCIKKDDAYDLAFKAALSWSTNKERMGFCQETINNQIEVTKNDSGCYVNFYEDQCQHYEIWVESISLKNSLSLAYTTDFKRNPERVI